MGVTGLWRLIEPAGQPVPVETLENKILAVDISIWLHQVVKGYQDAKGAPLPNAHLMGLFQRLCKLLYFRIKPVFVFDGGFPDLKRETIAKRQDNKSRYHSESERLKREIALLLSKKTAVGSLLGKQISPKKNSSHVDASNDDLFKLPALPQKEIDTESESDTEDSTSSSTVDLHSIDVDSDSFKSMPIKEKYDLLVELKETRKMNSWGKLHELPKKSDNFSDFQMQRLLKRRKVQECLQETEKEMGGNSMSLNELESLLNEEGIDTKLDTLPTRRIASDNNTRFLLINSVKQALAEAKKKKQMENQPGPSTLENKPSNHSKQYNEHDNVTKEDKLIKDELEDDLQKAIKMSLECMDESQSSINISKTDESWTSFLTDSDDTCMDSEEEDGFVPSNMATAKAYIMQYSDLTHNAINDIMLSKNNTMKVNQKTAIFNNISEEIQQTPVIVEKIDISSTEEIRSDIKDSSIDNVENVISGNNTGKNVLYLNLDDINANCGAEDTNSTDDDFVEVAESEEHNGKKVVELTLKMDEVLDDDIFADVFEINEYKKTSNVTNESISSLGCDRKFVEKIFKSEGTSLNNSEYKFNIQETNDKFSKNIVINHSDNKGEKSGNEGVIVKNTISDKKLDTEKKHISIENLDLHKNISKGKLNTRAEDIQSKERNLLPEQNQMTLVVQESQKKIIIPEKLEPQKKCILVEELGLHENVMSKENLNIIAEDIQIQEQDLLQEKRRMDRIGRNITEQMTKEAQELLQIFGIPYIVAPMEAEAQCAFLESVNLTDGTITDDSDIWLFGGKTVYKNFFNQKKTVLQFLSERIERSYNLTREQLILLALLVGSDYTTGVNGVGPVTALEILASFPLNKRKLLTETSDQGRYTQIVDGLSEFKKWIKAGRRTDNISLKKKLKNVNVAEDFPSIRVVQAYLEPNVERSKERFTWGELDITVLRDYTKAKFGWSQNKLDEIINPVLKRMLDPKKQKSIQDYFNRKIEFQSLDDQMSKRVKAAIQKMDLEGSCVQDEIIQHKTKLVNKRKSSNKTNEDCSLEASKTKQKKIKEAVIVNKAVKVISVTNDNASGLKINIPKTDRVQEIIPQREKDKQCLLQNKMKAIEIFRKTNIDRKKKFTKRKANLPKDKADLSESSDSD